MAGHRLRKQTTALPTPKRVISTEATDSLTVRRAVDRRLYFAFAVASLVVIPEGDLLLALAVALPLVVAFAPACHPLYLSATKDLGTVLTPHTARTIPPVTRASDKPDLPIPRSLGIIQLFDEPNNHLIE
jgi:hypothetical protein